MLYCKVFLIPYSPSIAYMTTRLKKLILVICFHLGVSGVAISTVISNVISAVMVMIYLYRRDDAFAQATVTFTSQNYGAGNIRRCKKVFWLNMLFGIVFTEILAVIFIVWSDFFVGIYTESTTVAAYALIRMYHVCSLEGLTTTYEVESAALRGMGKSVEPAILTILGTVVFRLIWLGTVFRLRSTFDWLLNVYAASWIFTGCALFIVYVRHMKRVEGRQKSAL